MRKFNLKLYLLIFLFTFVLIYPVYSKEPLIYDVLVIGGEPEGISAAVSASRRGAKVILLDTRAYVGGLYTSGMLSMLDMNYKASDTYQTVNEGFFKEFYDDVARDANIDIETTKAYFADLLEGESVTTELNASCISPIKNQSNAIIGATYVKDGLCKTIRAKVFIDASRDAEFARNAGVSYRVGRQELGVHNDYAAATLVFSVKGVDWDKVREHLNSDDSIYTGANRKAAWGYSNMLKYRALPKQFQLRGLNLSLQDDGSVVINALQVFHTDSLDHDSIQQNYKKAIKQLPRIVRLLRAHAVGFEEARLYRYADELYIREGVRIIGEYTLTGEDAFNNVDFENKIAYASYPIDLQATHKDSFGGCTLAAMNIYSIPITVMVPKIIDNLLVVGRSASFDPVVHGSARTVPAGMALGQAAGTLAAYSIQHSLLVRACSLDHNHVNNIQSMLIADGVKLDTVIKSSQPEKGSWAYPYMVGLRKKAFLSMEYKCKNNYRCNRLATFGTVSRILTLVSSHSHIKIRRIRPPKEPMAVLTPCKMVNVANDLLGTHYKTLSDLYNAKIIDEKTFKHLRHKSYLLNEDVYAMMYHIIWHAAFS
ncbi:FAD-dependent oxidoreductase [Cellulosilyticum sp. I15G10I2]|uniref:FAD-dependent oxidoreductase n=1 Tax=Cellulosilyticum sp. I15G10I2 TaxID=1892843 RepID=UPI00085C5E28|nr:FAD-dependent oxidoreductase [Cellulosilyticum sp. I15G10I2]